LVITGNEEIKYACEGLLGNYGWIQMAWDMFNALNDELNPICPLLALFRAHHIFHVSRIRVKGCTLFKNIN